MCTACSAAKNTTSRFEAAHAGSLTPLIGRSSELSLLARPMAENQGRRRPGHLPFRNSRRREIEAPARIESHIQHEPHVLLHYQGSPYHSQSAFFPMIEQIEQAAQLTARETDADKLAKLEAYLPRSTDSSNEPVLLIAKLLSIPLDGPGTIRPDAAADQEQDDKHARGHAAGVFRTSAPRSASSRMRTGSIHRRSSCSN